MTFFLALGALLMTQALAQETDWLSGMPSAQQVVAGAQGGSARDMAARASTSLQLMDAIVQSLSPQPFNERTLPPDVRRRLGEYRVAREQIDEREQARYAGQNCEGDGCEKYLYPRCQQKYYFSAAWYRMVLDRHFSPEWQRTHVPRLRGTLWKDALKLAPGAALSADFGAGLPCSGAGQGVEVIEPGLVDQAAAFLGGTRRQVEGRKFIDEMMLPLGITLIFAVFCVLMHLRQFGRYIAIDESDPMKVKSSVQHILEMIAGVVLSPTKGIQTITHVSGGGPNNQSVSSSTETVIHDLFFVRAPDGTEREIKLTNVDVSVREGHQMSVVWSVPAGRDGGTFMLLRNHSTRRTTYFSHVAEAMLGVQYRYIWLMLLAVAGFITYASVAADRAHLSNDTVLVLLALVGLPAILLFFVLGIALMVSKKGRLARFRKQAEERLVAELDRRAARQPA